MEKELVRQLGYEGVLVDIREVAFKYPDYADIVKTGAEKVYFSSGRPAVLFIDVTSFDNNTLKRVADVQRNAWNYERVMLLYASSDVEIRIYNCYGLPVKSREDNAIKDELSAIQLSRGLVGENLEMLVQLFSRINVESGTLWTVERAAERNKIRCDQRVDAYLIKCMREATDILKQEGLVDESIIHSLLIRSLFILFLEDKGSAREAGLYESIQSGATSYFDLLKDKRSTYRLYNRLHEQFNGNITMLPKDEEDMVTARHLEVIASCFFDGDFQHQNLFHERLFNFDIIHIGLISEIYENFLGELRHDKGQFYTPFALVDMILSEVLPSSSVEYNYPFLDPACGSGIFLVEGYKRLINRWQKAHPREKPSFEVLASLLQDNVFGVEIDATAIKVAAFSLYLTLIDKLDPKTLWNSGDIRLPYLIYDPDDTTLEGKQGRNLLRRDTIKDVIPQDMPKLRLLIGNPPYGTENLSSSIKEYCKREGFAVEYVLPFMHKATLLCPEGEMALVFTSKILFNTNGGYERFRKWLFGKNRVRRLDNLSIFRKAPKTFGGSLFSDASCPVCVAYYTVGEPERGALVKYCSPKTFIRTSLVDGLLIDESDIKMLPVEECQRYGSKIMKVAAWGNYYGYKLIERLSRTTLKDYFDVNGWVYGRGLNAEVGRLDFIPDRIIGTNSIGRYWSDLDAAHHNTAKMYRKVKEGLFDAPFIVFKQGQHHGKIACSLFEEPVYFTTTAFALNGGSLEDKKILTAYLNSRLVEYFLFLTTSSWGVEREQVFMNEVLNLPSPFGYLTKSAEKKIVGWFDQLYKLTSESMPEEERVNKLEQDVESEFEKAFGLSEKDVVYVYDTLDYNLGIFRNKMDAVGYRRTLLQESKGYAKVLNESLASLMGGEEQKVSVTVYDVQLNDPLQMAVVKLKSKKNVIEEGDVAEYRRSLKTIDCYLVSQHSDSIYLRKSLRYYDGSMVYIIKPNQKRFWSKMQAYEDAASIVNDILNM